MPDATTMVDVAASSWRQDHEVWRSQARLWADHFARCLEELRRLEPLLLGAAEAARSHIERLDAHAHALAGHEQELIWLGSADSRGSGVLERLGSAQRHADEAADHVRLEASYHEVQALLGKLGRLGLQHAGHERSHLPAGRAP